VRNLDRFALFNTAQECADSAAPIFKEHEWRWYRSSVPNHHEILDFLYRLRIAALSSGKTLSLQYAESGRLIFIAGQFGHERPKP